MKSATLRLPIWKGQDKPVEHLKRVRITYLALEDRCELEFTHVTMITDTHYWITYTRYPVSWERANILRRQMDKRGVCWRSESSSEYKPTLIYNVSDWLRSQNVKAL